jgi:hypothetical protein
MNNWMETKVRKLKCVVNDDNVLLDEFFCFIPKKQLDEEKNVLRNTHVYKFSLKRDSELHPKLLNVNQSFKYMHNPTHR